MVYPWMDTVSQQGGWVSTVFNKEKFKNRKYENEKSESLQIQIGKYYI